MAQCDRCKMGSVVDRRTRLVHCFHSGRDMRPHQYPKSCRREILREGFGIERWGGGGGGQVLVVPPETEAENPPETRVESPRETLHISTGGPEVVVESKKPMEFSRCQAIEPEGSHRQSYTQIIQHDSTTLAPFPIQQKARSDSTLPGQSTRHHHERPDTINSTELRVFLYIHNGHNLPQVKIAKKLGVHRSYVSHAIKAFITYGFLRDESGGKKAVVPASGPNAEHLINHLKSLLNRNNGGVVHPSFPMDPPGRSKSPPETDPSPLLPSHVPDGLTLRVDTVIPLCLAKHRRQPWRCRVTKLGDIDRLLLPCKQVDGRFALRGAVDHLSGKITLGGKWYGLTYIEYASGGHLYVSRPTSYVSLLDVPGDRDVDNELYDISRYLSAYHGWKFKPMGWEAIDTGEPEYAVVNSPEHFDELGGHTVLDPLGRKTLWVDESPPKDARPKPPGPEAEGTKLGWSSFSQLPGRMARLEDNQRALHAELLDGMDKLGGVLRAVETLLEDHDKIGGGIAELLLSSLGATRDRRMAELGISSDKKGKDDEDDEDGDEGKPGGPMYG